jgi:glycerol-3-phosphate dehydrogenase
MQRDPSKLANNEYDLVVIGGGIYGACVAWDAALRGLSVALVERGDFGQETSANSLKTVHGGLRYLQDFDFKLVRMMIEERSAYLRIAPHLVQPLACITPTYSRITKSKAVMGTALKLNDFAGYDRNKLLDIDRLIPPSQLLSQESCQQVLPGLPIEGVTGAALWHDAQIYDTERLNLAFITSAVNRGAEASNYVEATGLLIEDNQVIGITARDIISADEFSIRSRVVVNSAGPWIDSVLNSLDQGSIQPIFQHSLAVNIITRRIVENYAVGVPSWPGGNDTAGSDPEVSHMLFVSPWRGNSIIGTFHSHYHGNPDEFSLEEIDLQKIIQEANSAYPGAQLELDDIKFIHFGFLPEVSTPAQQEVKLVRKSRIADHETENGISGLISVMGVKYTTARHAAEKAVDLVYEKLGVKPPSSNTKNIQVIGGQIHNFGEYLSNSIEEDSAILTPETIDHWVRSYGSEYLHVKALLAGSENEYPLGHLSGGVIKAQVSYAVQQEMATKLADVVLRRTGIGTIGKPDDKILATIAESMASELGWSSEKIELELEEVIEIYRIHGSKDPMAENLEIS